VITPRRHPAPAWGFVCPGAIVLSDGGVYDNPGLETVWKDYQTVLVSDGGKKLAPDKQPAHNWLSQTYRVLETIDSQVGSLRKRQLIDGYKNPANDHDGTYWGIGSQVKDYGLADPIDAPEAHVVELANTATRLQAMDGRYLGAGSRITPKRARIVMSADATKTATHVHAMTSLMVSSITNLCMFEPNYLTCLV
jgi:hypothetical protein